MQLDYDAPHDDGRLDPGPTDPRAEDPLAYAGE